MENILSHNSFFRAFCDFQYALGDNPAQAVTSFYENIPQEYLSARELIKFPSGNVSYGIDLNKEIENEEFLFLSKEKQLKQSHLNKIKAHLRTLFLKKANDYAWVLVTCICIHDRFLYSEVEIPDILNAADELVKEGFLEVSDIPETTNNPYKEENRNKCYRLKDIPF